MRKGLTVAAAAAFLLGGGPALAQPAPGSVCDFVQGAIVDSTDHFEHLKGPPAKNPGAFTVKPGFGIKDANNCSVAPATTGKMGVVCNWIRSDEADARAFVKSLSQEVGACLGSGRPARQASDGVGVIFANGPKYDIAEVTLLKDSLGDWVVIMLILEDHEMLH